MKTCAIAILWLLLTAPLFGEQKVDAATTCPTFEDFSASLEMAPYISLTFTQMIYSDIFESIDTTRGTLVAGHDGRFRLESSRQAIVCDGIEYWSYSPSNEQVLVDSVYKIGIWNPLTLVYDPENVYGCNEESRRKDTTIFMMKARDTHTSPQEFALKIESDSRVPLEIEYYDDNNSRILILITNFYQIEEVPTGAFKFVPPADTEIIYMP